MKIQMQRQSLRLRVSEQQLAALRAGEAVENLTRLAPGAVCRQVVTATDDGPACLEISPVVWSLRLPRQALEAYAARLPCREGLGFALPTGDEEVLQVSFEVDVRDSVRHRGTAKRKPAPDGDDERTV
ncbi:hypothetical protein OK348_08540 [Flavobacterium sp. MXW15]|uniref:PilZ domain-containing protein n=1 Tax=Xanthomonas chitinilytica TaxID=2989819 RepID=A0ABT3JVM3_9XANT|nr:hypothetical protein [Xanthomonas sp. H13-6]MCW4454844.1 hypothetical protein [Flavobacterium sp. MXW15]MCW4472528.1 hypothetical protein [Xanthomonas sp. H13-6]